MKNNEQEQLDFTYDDTSDTVNQLDDSIYDDTQDQTSDTQEQSNVEGFEDLWYNNEETEPSEEIDDSDFGNEFYYIQDGVYADLNTGIVYAEKSVLKYIVKNNSRYYEYNTGKLDSKGKPVIKKLRIKKYKRKEKKTFDIGIFREENFGVLLPFVNDHDVTDINWNGSQLWIDDVNKGRYKVDTVLDKEFVDIMSIRIANVVSKTFNKYQPSLEAETDELRITILHESISNTGRAISIRKTPALKRINFLQSIKNGDYCSEEVANFMSNSVKAKLNIIVCGLPGVGKTELIKFLTNYIFPSDRVITVEDTLEIHYDKINPDKDSLVLKVTPQFSYTQAIKESLRLLPQWVLLSEARSTEVKYLIESVSTGTKCMTTIHADDVRKIPDRIVNMVGDINQGEVIKDSVHSFFDVGILIDKQEDAETGRIRRWISQICLFDRSNDENKCIMIVENGEFTGNQIPQDILRKFRLASIIDPYAYTFIKRR